MFTQVVTGGIGRVATAMRTLKIFEQVEVLRELQFEPELHVVLDPHYVISAPRVIEEVHLNPSLQIGKGVVEVQQFG